MQVFISVKTILLLEGFAAMITILFVITLSHIEVLYVNYNHNSVIVAVETMTEKNGEQLLARNLVTLDM
jgi:hypothetical protein